MKKHNKDILKATLFALIAIFIMIGAAGLLFANQKKKLLKEHEKKTALEILERIPTVTPTLAVTATPTPTPTATPTPTPVITRAPAFEPSEYLGYWYSKDGLASVNLTELTEKSVTFTFTQTKTDAGTASAEKTAKIAGNAAKLQFTDSLGNTVSGNMTFDRGMLYLRLETTNAAEGADVVPGVDEVLTREQATPKKTEIVITEESDYFFPDSDSRYLTEEDFAGYSSDELELAKNEIYARHGRKFVTPRIADYFNSKSWYEGTIDGAEFDARTDIFNEYEVANIGKIAEIEMGLRAEGK